MPIVTAHAIAAHVDVSYGPDASARLQRAMEQAILQCNQEGIANNEENAPLIKERIRRAQQMTMASLAQEAHQKAVDDAVIAYRERAMELERAHREHLATMALAFQAEMATIQATIDEVK